MGPEVEDESDEVDTKHPPTLSLEKTTEDST